MHGFPRIAASFLLLAAVLYSGERRAAAQQPDTDTSLEIGMPQTLFQGIPQSLMSALSRPFKDLLMNKTGFDGYIHQFPDAMTVAKEIESGNLNLGVFQGHEFAWAKVHYPKLEPIAIALPAYENRKALLLVRADQPASNLSGLKNSKLVYSSKIREFATAFLDKEKRDFFQDARFSATFKKDNAIEAIGAVASSHADVALVEQENWEVFQILHPSVAKNLKVLCQSEPFPDACVAFRKGSMVAKDVDSIRQALLTAKTEAKGKRLMNLWKLKGFEEVPLDYDKQLQAMNKLYPIPPEQDPKTHK